MAILKQIAALKYLIFHAKEGTDLCKRLLAFLIDESRGFTRPVCVTLVENVSGFTASEIRDAALSLDCMVSCNNTTHINQILIAMGCDFLLCVHYGDFDPTREKPFNTAGQFAGFPEEMVIGKDSELRREGMPVRYTFWLADEYYAKQAILVVTTREELEQIDLNKPGLYPNLESQK
jgi:hypothetical protein